MQHQEIGGVAILKMKILKKTNNRWYIENPDFLLFLIRDKNVSPKK